MPILQMRKLSPKERKGHITQQRLKSQLCLLAKHFLGPVVLLLSAHIEGDTHESVRWE